MSFVYSKEKIEALRLHEERRRSGGASLGIYTHYPYKSTNEYIHYKRMYVIHNFEIRFSVLVCFFFLFFGSKDSVRIFKKFNSFVSVFGSVQ